MNLLSSATRSSAFRGRGSSSSSGLLCFSREAGTGPASPAVTAAARLRRRVHRRHFGERTISSSVIVAGRTHASSSSSSISSPRTRLSLIARHLDTRPLLQINTPFSTERISQPDDDLIYTPLIREPSAGEKDESDIRRRRDYQQRRNYSTTSTSATASATEEKALDDHEGTMSTQPEHPTLLIPGPIEFDDEVLQSMGHFSESHVGQGFVNCFGEALTMLRQLFQTTHEGSQPFVVSGSGTLGWDFVAANLVERGDEVLVLHTGYFADSFTDCFAVYGVTATQLKAPIGSRPSVEEVEAALAAKPYKMVTITHVDTSTGVLSDVQKLAAAVHKARPDALVVVDGVCSVGSEAIEFDNWGLDVVLTASQKGIGVPAGLSILMCSQRAIDVFKARKSPPGSYFASFKNWLPIMQNYEAKKASYFATPSPQLIHALHTSLRQILAHPLNDRFQAQHEASLRVKKAIEGLGLKQLAADPECQANGMTAFWLPNDLTPATLMPALVKKGVVLAGGLHKEVATKYMRFGHMGVSALDPKRSGDLDKAFKALEEVLADAGYKAPSAS